MLKNFYIFMVEDGEWLPCGDSKRGGYTTIEEARSEAKRYTDDALPNNSVRVMQFVDYALIGGDGGTYLKSEEGK